MDSAFRFVHANPFAKKTFFREFRDIYVRRCDDSLGTGSYASVDEYLSLEDMKMYAVKTVRNVSRNAWTKQQVDTEVELFGKLNDMNCPNIIRLVEYFEDGNDYHLVFEKASHGDLFEFMKSKGRFSETEVAVLTKDVVKGLKVMHDQGVMHRDIKMENVLLHMESNRLTAKLCDLNLSSDKPTDMARLVGTLGYCAPEMAINRLQSHVTDMPSHDKRCDLWSLGVLVYELLFMMYPFEKTCSSCRPQPGVPKQKCECETNTAKCIVRGEYMFPEHRKCSSEAMDFVRQLLVVDPAGRMGLGDLLKHPFLCPSHR